MAPLLAQNEIQNLHHGLSALTRSSSYYSLGLSPTTVPLPHSTPVTLAFLLFCDRARHCPASGPSHLLLPMAACLFSRQLRGSLLYFMQVSAQVSLYHRISMTILFKIHLHPHHFLSPHSAVVFLPGTDHPFTGPDCLPCSNTSSMRVGTFSILFISCFPST